MERDEAAQIIAEATNALRQSLRPTIDLLRTDPRAEDPSSICARLIIEGCVPRGDLRILEDPSLRGDIERRLAGVGLPEQVNMTFYDTSLYRRLKEEQG